MHESVDLGFTPARVEIIDLDRPLPDLGGVAQERVHALIRVGPTPVGTVDLDPRSSPSGLEAAVSAQLGPAIDQTRSAIDAEPGAGRGPSSPDDGSGPSVAVVIATRDRPEQLQTCLDSLAGLDRPPDQLVVVDNAPSDDRTSKVVETWEHDGVPSPRYACEPVAGLARAHNLSLDLVETDIVAFTDDDVIIDNRWLDQLVAGFEGPEVGAVTGMIFPAELDTWPQQWADDTIGFNKGYRPVVFDLDANRPDSPLFPFQAGLMGSGANMAFRTGTLRQLGGFDPALGAGTPALGGDDLHAFYSVVTGGHSVVYQPSAIVLHRHHRTSEGLLRQSYGYGAGLTAYLTSLAMADPSVLLRLGRRLASGLAWLRSNGRPGADPTPRGPLATAAVRAQRRGMANGPVAYLRSLRTT